MNNDTYLQRARLLMEQHRPGQAAEQLRQVLANNPNIAEAHSLLALCLLENRDQWHNATREAEMAIGLSPDSSLSHYVLATILEKRNRFPEALQALDQAIQLAPEQSHFYGLKASILGQQSRWLEALEAATVGLSLDAEDESCSSIRAIAMERLGKVDSAIDQANTGVSRRPDSSMAHSTRGWALLQSGRYQEAQEAFREALRLGPTNEMARVGMIQALNSNHFFFRMIFSFYTFIGRMAQWTQWAILIGMFVGMRMLRAFAQANPEWQPYVLPISVLYLAFCLLSWISTPLFNTFLRFHPFGKYLLSNREKWASNLVAILGVVAVLGAILQGVRGDYGGAILMFIAPLFLSMPVSTAFSVDSGWPRYTCIAISVTLGFLCFVSLLLIASDGRWTGPFALYGLGIMLFTFLGNYLTKVTVRR
jgi:tetratricopeptide (TPR) repeat protein